VKGQLLSTLDTQQQAVFNMEELQAGVYFIKEIATGRIQKWQKL
jgi:hypothetical protein